MTKWWDTAGVLNMLTFHRRRHLYKKSRQLISLSLPRHLVYYSIYWWILSDLVGQNLIRFSMIFSNSTSIHYLFLLFYSPCFVSSKVFRETKFNSLFKVITLQQTCTLFTARNTTSQSSLHYTSMSSCSFTNFLFIFSSHSFFAFYLQIAFSVNHPFFSTILILTCFINNNDY